MQILTVSIYFFIFCVSIIYTIEELITCTKLKSSASYEHYSFPTLCSHPTWIWWQLFV